MAKYRKKPVEIEAFQFTSPEAASPEWMTRAYESGKAWYSGGPSPYVTIATLEGDMRASLGDWIIQGVKGEVYPCKPDIFEVLYEAA